MSPIILDPLTAATDAAILGPTQRILRGVSATLGYSFTQDGATFDPGTATVSITASDGTAIAVNAATTEAVSGVFTYTLTPAQIPQVDRLEVVWSAVVGGQTQRIMEIVEVAGGFVFNVADLRAELTTSTTTYTAAQIANARTYAETELETACGIAFVTRFDQYRGNGDGSWLFTIPAYPLRTIRWATVNGVALSVSEVDALNVSATGTIYGRSWTSGYGNITVGFEYGLDYASPGASEAAKVLAKHQLVKGPIDERATQRPSEFGPVNLATPGMFGARFGIPVVDAFVSANRIPNVA